MQHDSGLIATLMKLPIFQAEWVLWLLIALSLASVAVMVERFLFYRRHAIDISRCAGCWTKAT
jgi:biopolymer transport protein ExbB/TolQ